MRSWRRLDARNSSLDTRNSSMASRVTLMKSIEISVKVARFSRSIRLGGLWQKNGTTEGKKALNGKG
jgi:hypothetical protein